MATNNQFIRTYDDDARVVMLKRVRLSFSESLKDKKATVEDGDPKHSTNVLIESDQPGFDEKKQAIVAAMKAACEKAKKPAEYFKTIAEDAPKRVSYRKGERFKNKDGVVYEGYAGNMAISASGPKRGQQRPTLFSRNKRKLGAPGQEGCFTVDDIPEIFYGGTYADVKVSFYYTDKGGDGLFATIESIRSLETGERMSGGGITTTADEFDDAEDDHGFDADSGSSNSSKSDDEFG